jgi:hypothetical protein
VDGKIAFTCELSVKRMIADTWVPPTVTATEVPVCVFGSIVGSGNVLALTPEAGPKPLP